MVWVHLSQSSTLLLQLMERNGDFQCVIHLSYFRHLLYSEMNHTPKEPVCLICPVK